MSGRKKEMVTLRVPGKDWALLLETLTLDSRSRAFDPELRRRIRDALKHVRQVDEPWVLTVVYAGVPDETTVFWDEKEAIKAAKRSVRELREEYDVLMLTQGGVIIYSWPKN